MGQTRGKITCSIHYISSGRGDPDEIDRVEIDCEDTHVVCYPKRNDDPAPVISDEIGADGRIASYDKETNLLLSFFAWKHLPPSLQSVSQPFHGLAHTTVAKLPSSTERTKALDKLLEAKDAAVRAAL